MFLLMYFYRNYVIYIELIFAKNKWPKIYIALPVYNN